MLPVGFPVLRVRRGQRLIPDDQEILGVLFLRRLREIKQASDDRLPIDDDVG
jgi:hypothetical protein